MKRRVPAVEPGVGITEAEALQALAVRIRHAYGLAFSAEVDVIGVGGEPESVQFRIFEADAGVAESLLVDVDDQHGLALLGARFRRDVYRAEEAGAVERLAAGIQPSGRQPVTLVDR